MNRYVLSDAILLSLSEIYIREWLGLELCLDIAILKSDKANFSIYSHVMHHV